MMYLIPIQAVAADHQVLPTEQVPHGLLLCNELLFGVSRYKSSALLRAWFCFQRPSVLLREPQDAAYVVARDGRPGRLPRRFSLPRGLITLLASTLPC